MGILIEAVRLYKKGYSTNTEYSFQSGQRKRAVDGLNKIATLMSESNEADQSLQKVAADAVLALDDIYFSK